MSNITSRNVKLGQALYETALVLQTFVGIMSFVNIKSTSVLSYIQVGVLIILAIRMFWIRFFSMRELLITFFLVIFLIITTYLSKSMLLLSSFAFILLGKDVDIDEAIRHIRPFYFFMIFLIVTAAAFGIIENEVKYMYVSLTDSYTYRQSMGFSNPNSFSAGVLQLALLSLWNTNKSKVSFSRVLFAVILSVISYKYTKSKSIIIAIGILVFAYFLEKLFADSKYWKKIFQLLILSPILASSLSLISAIKYNGSNPVWIIVNRMLSYRISYCHNVYERYGWSIAGQPITTSVGNKLLYIMDNAYIQLGFKYGIIWFIFFVGVSYFTMLYAYREKAYNKILILSVMLFYGMAETTMLLVYYNFAILFLTETYWRLLRRDGKNN